MEMRLDSRSLAARAHPGPTTVNIWRADPVPFTGHHSVERVDKNHSTTPGGKINEEGL